MATEIIGLSCVSVGAGQGGSMPILARVSIVDKRGNILYDTLVKPTAPVVSYRTSTTGLDANSFGTAVPFQQAQATAAKLIAGKILVGHQLWNDLSVLGICHPAVDTRDTALFLPFRAALGIPNQIIGLPTLVWHFMRRKLTLNIDSAEISRATVDVYRSHQKEWDGCILSGQWPCALPPSAYARCYS
ncbi:hypothetical protein FRC03_010050 [Tulasnella sp. 419]|nr:hypothetical protein FRC02_006447 [Tulasnella sp. 418]KAG8957536.1 hypothetical protein FRC03_010050 [Tulasnella sp. 419]